MDPRNVPSFEELEKEAIASSPSQLQVGTETIDLSGVLTDGLTTSGSFNALDTKESSFHKILHALPVPALLVNAAQVILFCNQAVARLTNHYRQLVGQKFSTSFLSSDRASSIASLVEGALRERKPKAKELRVAIHGRRMWARIYVRPLRLTSERAVLVILEDLTLEKRQLLLLDKIERAKQEWEQTFDRVQDAIAVLDPEYRILRLNKAAAARAGIDVKTAVGQPCYRIFHEAQEPPPFCPYTKALADGHDHSMEYSENHTGMFYHELIFPNRDSLGLVTGCVLVMSNVTERRALVEELKRQATHDSLTKLLNRQTVLELLASTLENARRYNVPLSVAICDLDDFKRVNDEFGHQAGDDVLRKFGKIVTQEFRRADFGGRYGGDEFLLVFPHTTVEGVSECLRRVREALQETTFEFAPESYRVTCSMGVAQFVPHLASADDLIHLADQALYEAKRNGLGIAVYSQSNRA
jgi:diguanylate cyclase (GGDEF)-like protein/PAS domain S-box-containing protein